MPEKTALVLGGGGARAAYQIGVLKAIVQFYPRNHGIPFKIICGTSAGAINGTSIATHASCFHLGVRKLEWVWRNFHTEKVYKSSSRGILGHLGRMLLMSLQDDRVNSNAGSLFNSEPLRVLLNQLINFARIDRNIDSGALNALSIDTSCYNTSRSVTFFQGSHDISDWHRDRRSGQRTQLNTEHLLASSAIPLIFPSIKLNQGYYGDGSVHQLAPLSSPIHLGAKKIMVINLESPHKQQPQELEHHPKTATITGHLLDTIFSDTLNSDLERLERINGTLKLIPEEKRKSLPLTNIETLVIKPSEDLSQMASHFYHNMPFAVKAMLRPIGIKQDTDSSIVSYLLFEQAYCSALIDLGYQDAMCQIDEIRAFFEI
ncbi:patatin-like phospholipase family protein [Shewanella eurypsychrophilus]|uniref:Patatin-like phospholipase family protein n=1 Tax=Shewanella eurypsychrophilus TaxID=2593656 RepID=A0ABX6V8N0_9GAMM|nr:MULTISPECIES: patatin-like phospholipase family protein [Shewanella]QFU23661.1 patatin-like phospholipase family protein [Shewanella sp. YLB-09]QPG58883.1 patatin-like phospholipase family protein [Shewanella eurypsychrophilus]